MKAKMWVSFCLYKNDDHEDNCIGQFDKYSTKGTRTLYFSLIWIKVTMYTSFQSFYKGKFQFDIKNTLPLVSPSKNCAVYFVSCVVYVIAEYKHWQYIVYCILWYIVCFIVAYKHWQ